MTAPRWYLLAQKEIGTREVGNNDGAKVRGYMKDAKGGNHPPEPWCADFVNAMLERSGVPGTRNPSSQSFRHDAHFVQLAGPALGAIAVFWRGSKASGLGHAGFYNGERGEYIWVLGGNEGDMVQSEALPRASRSMGLIGYWWPAGEPLPTIGRMLMSDGAPRHQQTPKVT